MGTDEPTFSELLDRARKGDPDAKALLFHDMAEQDEAGSQLLAMARKALPRGDPARDLIESRDLVQSALRSGWLDLSSFRGTTTAQLMSWMRTVLRRKLSRTIRKRQPRIGKDEAQDARGAVEGGEAGAASEEILRAEALRRVRSAVAALPDDQRIVMERRLDGRSAPEIARELDLTPAAVRKRESRAMARLREGLGGDPGTECEPT